MSAPIVVSQLGQARESARAATRERAPRPALPGRGPS